MEKPSIPKGTRDFGPAQMAKRNYILNNIKQIFQKYGFAPLETPTMENLSVLTGKYGDEGDQLLFKVLNSGDFLSKSTAEDVEKGSKHLTRKISEKGLRYDLTVPFARYVVMNQNEISFPFRRYQIQPVWRADRPQRGRYREFYQCDVDIVGTNSLLCESEIITIINEVFEALKLNDYSIKINNRKILTGIVESIGAAGKESEFCVAIDKLDKIGLQKVLDELKNKGFTEEQIQQVEPILSLSGTNSELLDKLSGFFSNSIIGMEGLAEIKSIFELSAIYSNKDIKVDFEPTLARGLSYYTGTIFEVKPTSVTMGSICGGGRYDDLTGIFGLKDVSGVGISFGVDRIYDVMESLELFPEDIGEQVKVLVCNFGEGSLAPSIKVLQKIRATGISAEIFPDNVKMKKQFNYANKKSIPYIVLIGSEELANENYSLKNMTTGEQKSMDINQIIDILTNN